MQSTKKAPARREDGVPQTNEEMATAISPATQNSAPQQVITQAQGFYLNLKVLSFSSGFGLTVVRQSDLI